MFNSPMLLDFNSNSKRSKITKACDNCRRRRVKCDGVPDGCGGCKAAKTQCVYTTSNTKRGPPKGYVEVIEDRLGKIENMLAGIVRKKKVVVTAEADKARPSSSSFSDNEDNNDQDQDQDDDQASIYSTDLVEVKKQPPASPALHPRSSTPGTPGTRALRAGSVTVSPLGRHSPLISRHRSLTSLLPFSGDQPGAQTEMSAQSSQADMAALTSMFDKLGTTSVRTTVPFPWLTPEQSRQYGRNYLQFSASSLEPALPILARAFPPSTSPETTLELIHAYFDHFNTFLPIVHRPTFLKQWQQAQCSLCPSSTSATSSSQPTPDTTHAHQDHLQNPTAPISPLLLNALLAVAARPTDKQSQEARQRAAVQSQAFFDGARLLLDDFMDVPRVSTVQALCLMSQFHHQGQWKASRSSTYLSMAIRMAHELGLNRDPDMVTGTSADSLRYLWWSMFILDHQFSAWLGLGLLMHGKESDVELPVDFGPEQQDLRGFICMVRLVKILGSVLQHSYSAQSLPPQFGGHDSMVSYIEGSLASWLNNLAPEMRWQNPNGNVLHLRRGSPASPMRSPSHALLNEIKRATSGEIYPAYLYIVYNTTLILLHRPYIVGAAGSPAAAQSNTICTGSGRAITDIAQGLDMDQCSYVVNRFTLYALLQAGVIHAMNAVYDKRGSEVAMEYYRRTVRVLEGFLACASLAGGVIEGIQILDQFLASTSKAAAEEEDSRQGQDMADSYQLEQAEGQPNRKKRQLESASPAIPSRADHATPSMASAQFNHPPLFSMPPPALQNTPALAPSSLSMMTTPDMTGLANPYQYDYQRHQAQSRQQMDLKEQQKQQQLKIQQQHRMYQQMQTFGASAAKTETKVDGTSTELQKLEQQQLQQQQLMRQQLQRQQQRQQLELGLKEQSTPSVSFQAAPNTMAAPVIPSHRHAMQLLAQQQQQQQHPQHSHQQQQQQIHQHAPQHQQQHGHPNMPMQPMNLSGLSMEGQGKMNHDLSLGGMGGVMTEEYGYDASRFWVDFSAADASPMVGSVAGSMTTTGLEQDVMNGGMLPTSRVTTSGPEGQFGGSLWI